MNTSAEKFIGDTYRRRDNRTIRTPEQQAQDMAKLEEAIQMAEKHVFEHQNEGCIKCGGFPCDPCECYLEHEQEEMAKRIEELKAFADE